MNLTLNLIIINFISATEEWMQAITFDDLNIVIYGIIVTYMEKLVIFGGSSDFAGVQTSNDVFFIDLSNSCDILNILEIDYIQILCRGMPFS